MSTRTILTAAIANAQPNSSLIIVSNSANELSGYTDEDIMVSDGAIKIKDIQTKFKLIAEHYYKSLKNESDHSFFSNAVDLFHSENIKDKPVIGHFILIGSHDFDVFLGAKGYILNGGHVFPLFQVLKAAIQLEFKYNTESFIDFFIFIYEKMQNDLAIGHHIKDLCDFIFKDEQKCIDMYHMHKTCKNKFFTPIFNNIAINYFKKHTWMKDELISEVKASNARDGDSIYLLGRILAEENIHSGEEIGLLLESCSSDSEDCKSSAFNALALHLGLAHEADLAFRQGIANKEVQALVALAYHLFPNWEKFATHPDFSFWIRGLAYIPPQLKGALGWRDHIFSCLVSDKYELVMETIESSFLFYKSSKEDFDIEEILPSTLQDFIKIDFSSTQLALWLKSKTLPGLAAKFIQFISTRKIHYNRIEFDKLNITGHDDLIFLCRSVTGNIFFEVDFLLHFFSQLATFYKNDRDSLSLIFEFIGLVAFDYPPQAEAALKELQIICSTEQVTKLKESLLSKMKGYFDALHALPEVNELCPTQSEERLFLKEKQENLSRQMQIAHEKSIISQIASSVPLKAGKAFFSYRTNTPDTPVPLVSHETTFLLPRSVLLDPVEYDLQRFLLRVETRGEE